MRKPGHWPGFFCSRSNDYRFVRIFLQKAAIQVIHLRRGPGETTGVVETDLMDCYGAWMRCMDQRVCQPSLTTLDPGCMDAPGVFSCPLHVHGSARSRSCQEPIEKVGEGRLGGPCTTGPKRNPNHGRIGNWPRRRTPNTLDAWRVRPRPPGYVQACRACGLRSAQPPAKSAPGCRGESALRRRYNRGSPRSRSTPDP